MTPETTLTKIVLDQWHSQLKSTDNLFDKLSDEQLMTETAPGRNRGIYLLGHMTAVHDMMLPLLRFEPSLYPELKPAFIDAPDKTVAELPSVAQLREQWKAVNEKLSSHISDLPDEEWLSRHASVSEEDFAREPHRNRLNVLLSRASHMGYHRGQLVYLDQK
jgi:uncharacterized damage-inducible protein DinB